MVEFPLGIAPPCYPPGVWEEEPTSSRAKIRMRAAVVHRNRRIPHKTTAALTSLGHLITFRGYQDALRQPLPYYELCELYNAGLPVHPTRGIVPRGTINVDLGAGSRIAGARFLLDLNLDRIVQPFDIQIDAHHRDRLRIWIPLGRLRLEYFFIVLNQLCDHFGAPPKMNVIKVYNVIVELSREKVYIDYKR